MRKQLHLSQILVVTFMTLISAKVNAQSLGLNNATPDASSIIDMTATNRGMLAPRMTQAQRNAIALPATSLLIFQTDNSPGFYYNAGTPAAINWVPFLSSLVTGPAGWSILGNAGTTAGTNFVGTTDAIDFVVKTNSTERLRVYNGNGLLIAPLSAASSTALDIGALSAATANKGVNIGAISGAGTAAGITSGAISSTGATAYHINLGAITGANATSHTGINVGNISGATTDAYGLSLGTITGGTASNNGISVGAITSTGATNSYGVNVSGLSGSGTNNYGINVGSLTSTGVSSAINIAGLSGAGTTNTGLSIGTVSGGSTNNFGLRVTGTAAAASNYAIYADAPAQNYFLGAIAVNTLTPDPTALLDMASSAKGLLVPRMTTAQRTAIASPANGLFVYDTDMKTFYYYDAVPVATWRPLYSSATTTSIGWSVTGNNAIVEGTHFVGTIGNVDVTVRANNLERFRVNFDDGPEIAPIANAITATPTGLKIGALSGNTSNTGINIGAISGSGTAAGITSGAISATGATAYHLNLGSISGANATSHTGINLGNISGATADAYGLNLGTITGGTASNNGINIGAITSTGATNSYGVNISGLSGSGTNNFGMNIGALTSTGVSSGINIAGLSGAGTTNTGLKIGAVSGGTTNNFGLRVTGTTASATNYALYVDAPAENYLAGQTGIGTTTVNASTGIMLDVHGTIIGALPLIASDFAWNDGTTNSAGGVMISSVPSTNNINISSLTTTGNITTVRTNANWTNWVSLGQVGGINPTTTGIYIISMDVSLRQNDIQTSNLYGFITVRMSDGSMYFNSTNNNSGVTKAVLGTAAGWNGWLLISKTGAGM